MSMISSRFSCDNLSSPARLRTFPTLPPRERRNPRALPHLCHRFFRFRYQNRLSRANRCRTPQRGQGIGDLKRYSGTHHNRSPFTLKPSTLPRSPSRQRKISLYSLYSLVLPHIAENGLFDGRNPRSPSTPNVLPHTVSLALAKP
ncbi:unnamed protein product [Citrullus colocynthis]|uniref:Uncharacterized protein n=1 Tax=Citrullus colocynthis TaxID=252529 RepID=A0ABP0YFJ5_9ROSI